MNRKRAYGLSAAITFVLLLPALVYLDGPAFLERLRRIGWGWVAIGCAAGVAYQGVRALRFAYLLDLGWSLRLTATMCFHGVARKLLPVWIGEGLGVWLFQRRHAVRYGFGAGSLVLARAVDLAIVGLALLALLLGGAIPGGLPGWVRGALAGLLALSMGLVGAILIAGRLREPTAARRIPAVRALFGFVDQTARAVRFGLKRRVLGPTVMASAAMWAVMYGQHYSFVRALGYELAWSEVLWIQLLLVPIQVLPIRGFADLGTHETAWMLGAVAVGITGSKAAELALGTHLLAFIAAGGYFLIGCAIDTGIRLSRGRAGSAVTGDQ